MDHLGMPRDDQRSRHALHAPAATARNEFGCHVCVAQQILSIEKAQAKQRADSHQKGAEC